jgi:dUTP pyrophosphatase
MRRSPAPIETHKTFCFAFFSSRGLLDLQTSYMLNVKIINRSPYALPTYATDCSAGMDLNAYLASPVTLGSLERQLIPTGISIELPIGYEAQVRPRSGLAMRHGLTCLNSPGTIDADYRGEIGVVLVNLSHEPYTVSPGERVAQLVVARHEYVAWQPVEQLGETSRGQGGFGHTGK